MGVAPDGGVELDELVGVELVGVELELDGVGVELVGVVLAGVELELVGVLAEPEGPASDPVGAVLLAGAAGAEGVVELLEAGVEEVGAAEGADVELLAGVLELEVAEVLPPASVGVVELL